MTSKVVHDRLYILAEEACKMASQEVIRTAIHYGTSIVIEQDGKVIEVEANPDSGFFGVIDSGSN